MDLEKPLKVAAADGGKHASPPTPLQSLLRRGIVIGSVSLLAIASTLAAYYFGQRALQDRILQERRAIQTTRLAVAVTMLRVEAVRAHARTGDQQRLAEASRYAAAIGRGLDTLAVLARDSASSAATASARRELDAFESEWVAPVLDARRARPVAPPDSMLRAGEAPLARVRGAFEDLVSAHEARFRMLARQQRLVLGGGIAFVLLELLLIAAILWRFERRTIEYAGELAEKNSLLQDQQVELEQQTEEAQVLAEELEQSNQELGDALRLADVSRDAALRAARESASHLALLDSALSSAPVAIGFLGDDLRFQRVNPRLEAMAGHPDRGVVGRALQEVFPDHARQVIPLLRQIAITGAPVTNQVLHSVTAERTPQGEWLVSYYPVPSDGGAPTIGMVATDMTELRLLEAQLRQAQKMEAVGRLAGGVAHDFNNLLTVIIAHAGLAKELAAGASNAPLRDDLHEIEQAARRAASLTHQLLAFSRQQVLQPRTVDVNESIRNLERMLQRLIGEDVSLRTELGSSWPVWVDPGQLDQIIMNLVVNARDAMPHGGELSIATRNIGRPATTGMDRSRDRREFVLIEVRDTGVGMDEATRLQIFEPFFTTKEKGRGTGLGLSTVYGIVQQTGGEIAVETALGAGTTFRVFLPRSRQGTAVGLQENHSTSAGGSEHILIVEDEAAVRNLLDRVLTRAGYHVRHAATGAEAIGLARDTAQPIDLLITDMIMPGMSGDEVREAVRSLHSGARVLYVSGYTQDDILRRGLGHASQAFLQKPFTSTQLLARVREVLDSPLSMTGEHPIPRADLASPGDRPVPTV